MFVILIQLPAEYVVSVNSIVEDPLWFAVNVHLEVQFCLTVNVQLFTVGNEALVIYQASFVNSLILSLGWIAVLARLPCALVANSSASWVTISQ